MRKTIFVALALAFAGQPLSAATLSTAKLHKSAGTAIDSNGVVTAIAAGTTVIDTATVKCAAAAGCIIGIEVMAQVIANGSAGQWQICARVDGTQAGPGCPVQGQVPTTNYVVGNLRANMPVTTGTHTVSFEVTMPSSGSIAAWEGDYTVYKN